MVPRCQREEEGNDERDEKWKVELIADVQVIEVDCVK